MNDQALMDLLERTGERVTVGPVPLAAIADGAQRRRRNRTWGMTCALVGPAVLVTLVVAIAGAAPRVNREGPAVSPPAPGSTIIHVQDGSPDYVFRPSSTPQRAPDPYLTATDAYNTMVGTRGLSQSIPQAYSAYFGWLTEGDTTPVADQMPVWAFVSQQCVSTGPVPNSSSERAATPSNAASPGPVCRSWRFANARTGRDLGVVDQQTTP